MAGRRLRRPIEEKRAQRLALLRGGHVLCVRGRGVSFCRSFASGAASADLPGSPSVMRRATFF